jgi:hypothetical protein
VSEIRQFLDLIYPKEGAHRDYYLSLWELPTRRSYHLPLRDAQVEATAVKLDAEGHDVYFGTCLRADDLGTYERGKRSDVAWLPGFWADADIRGPAHVADNLPPSLEAAVEAVQEFDFEPTVVVDSGHGMHLWWLFDKPIAVHSRNVLELQGRAKSWHEKLAAIWERRGWRLDNTSDLSRVLRLPGTHNRKLAHDVRRVKFLTAPDSGARYDYRVLEKFLGATKSKLAALLAAAGPPAVQTGPADAVSPAPVPTTTDARTKQEILEGVRSKLRGLRNRENKELFAKVLKGESFAEPGERDHQLQKAASNLAFCEPDAAPELLVELLVPSLAVMEQQHPDGAMTLDDAVEKISRAQSDARRKRAEEAERNRRMIEVLRRQANPPRKLESIPGGGPPTPALPGPVTSAAANVPPADARDSGVPRPGSTALALAPAARLDAYMFDADGKYTSDALGYFAHRQTELSLTPCTQDDWRKLWIIQAGTAFYVFSGGRYLAPIPTEMLAVSLPRDLVALPDAYFQWRVPTEKGERPKRKEEILADLATGARGVIAHLETQESFYDPQTQIFHEAACPLRNLEPRFDKHVDEWLRRLGGANVDKLLDWVAAVTLLQYQCCALYISGVPNSGKTMLAHGLARLWSEGGPTQLANIVDNFNSDLTRCPLVHADEYLPLSGRSGKQHSTNLRSLVAQDSRPLNRKYLASADLRGTLRLILTANNARLLNMGDEELEYNDLEATAGRFLHIDAGQEPRAYLQQLGGREGTDGWVDRDVIARHALWLRADRMPSPKLQSRFIVEGHVTAMHESLAVQGAVPNLVCEWLANHLTKAHAAVQQSRSVLVGNEMLLVNTAALVEHWEKYLPGTRAVPTTTRIGKALRNLSVPRFEKRWGGRRYHYIKWQLVLNWATEHLIGNPDEMRALIEKVRTDMPAQGRGEHDAEGVEVSV